MACNDGCHYGPAPHVCFYKIPGAHLGQSKVKPESEWPDSYEEDPAIPGLGIHHNCGWSRAAQAATKEGT